ncbi:hypothetical protein LINPERPRIM_LOCUS477, partial [Linum perenne]
LIPLSSQLLQHFLLINQSFTTLEQGANQSRGAWIEAHNLGRGACKRRIAMVFLEVGTIEGEAQVP